MRIKDDTNVVNRLFQRLFAKMLGLLIYCYAKGTFASRRIETHTFENVSVR